MEPTIPAPVSSKRVFTLVGVFLVLASSLGAQAQVPRSARDVHVRIETDRRTYRVGGPVKVRLTLQNLSSHPVRYISNPPAYLVSFQITDDEGREVKPGVPGLTQRLSMTPRHAALQAGEERTLRWQKSEWIDLQDWSYDFRERGRYTIVGIPMIAGRELKPDRNTVRSNEVTFTIEP